MDTEKKFIGIIPARYASTRFPGKPLAELRGKIMVQRVYEQASKALDVVFVATDDERIFNAVQAFGGNAVMTSANHRSGTDRCAEAVRLVEQDRGDCFDAVLNIQGDEPFIEPEQLELIKSCFSDERTQIATLVKLVDNETDLFDPNRPKVVLNKYSEAIYFSCSTIPYLRGKEIRSWLSSPCHYLHIGLYGFLKKVLFDITQLPQSSLELAESLEQLRWIENGYRIAVRTTTSESIGIDTPEDLQRMSGE